MQPFSTVLFGVIIGIVIGLGASIRWGNDISGVVTSPNFFTLLAGLGGAALGGLISFATARQTARETERRDEDSRMAIEKAQALNGLVNTMQLANRLFTLSNKLNEAANPPGGAQPWQILQASVGQGSPAPRYAPDEFIPFINAGHSELVHRALLLADRVDSLEVAFNKYSDVRMELEKFLIPFSVFQDGAMVSEIPPESLTEANYRMNMLNKLIMEMARYCARDFADAKTLLREMNQAFLDHFKHRANFRIGFEEDEATMPGKALTPSIS